MKKFMLFATLLGLCPLLLIAQVPDTVWTRTYGGTSHDHSFSVQQTADGGYIIGAETMSYGGGDWDIWLIKTDASGDTQWTKTYGGDSADNCRSVRQTIDGGYIVTGSTENYGSGIIRTYLIKTDSLGDSIWTKTFDANSVSYSVQQTLDGGYIIAGSIFYGYEFVYLIKTDGLGNTIWSQVYTYGTTCSAVQETSDGGYILAGSSAYFGAGSYDVWLLRIDENGDTLWMKTYGGTSWDYGNSVDQTADGGYVVTGRTNSFCVGYSDVWLLKTDENGDTLWTRTYGGIGCEGGRYVQETSDGGFMIVGYTDSYGAGDYDIYFVKTNSAGDTLWTKTYGGVDYEFSNSGRQTSDNGYIIAGYTCTFGAGLADVWLIKLAPEPGIAEEKVESVMSSDLGATIFKGPLHLPEGKKCRVFDITGRVVVPDKIRPGIYFIEIDGEVIRKVVKIR